jgi:hypothetical protein
MDDVRLIHILYPMDDASWSTRPTVEIFDDSGSAIVVSVQMSGGTFLTDQVVHKTLV